MVDQGFEHVDKNGDGEVDRKELRAAMKAHKLAQVVQPKNAAEWMDACDTNGNNKISKPEAKKCIKANVPASDVPYVDAAVDYLWP